MALPTLLQECASAWSSRRTVYACNPRLTGFACEASAGILLLNRRGIPTAGRLNCGLIKSRCEEVGRSSFWRLPNGEYGWWWLGYRILPVHSGVQQLSLEAEKSQRQIDGNGGLAHATFT